jgi:hypothetical protein
MNTTTFNRQKRQFRNLANRVSKLVLSGEWIKLSASTQNRIILKLNALYRQLRSYFTQPELRKILAAAAIFIGLPIASQAQSFAPPQLNPFGLAPDSVSLASPKFADIDHDGDFDLFTGNYGGFLQFYQNTGTPAAPAFALPQQNPFGINTPVGDYYIAFPAFADIDDDGDLDLFIGGLYSDEQDNADIQFYENTGTDVSPAFAVPQANPFGLVPAYIFAMPEFADIDNDGDLDLFVSEAYGNIQFFQNTGSATEPNFASPVENPFGMTPSYNFGSLAFADIDHDGDLDLFVGEYYGNMQFFENTGTVSAPAFAPKVTNPFGLVPTNYYNFPAIADLDDDGDFDILSGEYYGMFKYFKNTEINIGIGENQAEELFSLYPNPATDIIQITLMNEDTREPMQISIIDLNGRVIKTEEIRTDDLRLKTDDLSPGLYFVRLVQGDRVGVRKMVVRF